MRIGHLKDLLLATVSSEDEGGEIGEMVSRVEDESSSEADYGEQDNDEYPTEEDVHIATTPILSRSEREAMEEFAIREWCREETACPAPWAENGVTMIMNIELIYLKMCYVWTYSPIFHPVERWDDFSSPPPWNPRIQDVVRTMPLQTRPWEAAILEVLRMGAFPVDSATFLQPEHIEYVKNLLDEVGGTDFDELQSWEGINSGTSAASWTAEEQAEADAAAEWFHQTEDTDKKRKESCMDAMNLLDTIMKSGECMKEADYLKMCNLLKELYN